MDNNDPKISQEDIERIYERFNDFAIDMFILSDITEDTPKESNGEYNKS